MLRVGEGATYFINDTRVELEQIGPSLNAALEDASERAVFVTGSEDLPYGEVVRAIDAARRADITMIGLLPRSEADRLAGAQ